jgi:hypothetical protein
MINGCDMWHEAQIGCNKHILHLTQMQAYQAWIEMTCEPKNLITLIFFHAY